jgi:PPIC-type PPIASE domain
LKFFRISAANKPNIFHAATYLACMIKILLPLLLMWCCITNLLAQQKTTAQIKKELEATPNPVGYTREVLKKKYVIDTVVIRSTNRFMGIADSLGYTGKERKVYGPYNKKFLVQVLGKAPNTFNHLSQIFIDTSVFSYRIADSLANNIIEKIKAGQGNFEDYAQTYSMGGEAATRGDLGWIATGALTPEIEKELIKRRKGEVFKVWSRTGVHVLKKTSEPKQDYGFALLLRVFL